LLHRHHVLAIAKRLMRVTITLPGIPFQREIIGTIIAIERSSDGVYADAFRFLCVSVSLLDLAYQS